MTDWEQAVEAWQLSSGESYRHVTRLGQKRGIPSNSAMRASHPGRLQ